jgi:hypothetical protein
MTIDPKRHFSPHYEAARQRLRVAAEARGARLRSQPIGAQSLTGDELSIDIAYLGPDAPESVLARSRGLHGLEGFALGPSNIAS